jgi:chemotaxis protein methyltransferase CheR
MPNALVRPIAWVVRDLWNHVPIMLQQRPPFRTLGFWVHASARRFSDRHQSKNTWFLRNQQLLFTIRDIIEEFGWGESLRLCVLGCSTGAEVYSVLYILRKARPDLNILPIAVDISESAIDKARVGRYGRGDPELRGKLSEQQLLDLFDVTGQHLKIKPWIAEGIEWRVGDAADPGLPSTLGLQHIVLANNFLVHMREPEAIYCLGNVIQLVRPDGLFVCRGVDLDIRQRVVREFQLQPIATRIEEIHNSESALDARHGWPCYYWGLEPLDKTRPDWIQRYAALYRVRRSPAA